jgi:hypothetical protein
MQSNKVLMNLGFIASLGDGLKGIAALMTKECGAGRETARL